MAVDTCRPTLRGRAVWQCFGRRLPPADRPQSHTKSKNLQISQKSKKFLLTSPIIICQNSQSIHFPNIIISVSAEFPAMPCGSIQGRAQCTCAVAEFYLPNAARNRIGETGEEEREKLLKLLGPRARKWGHCGRASVPRRRNLHDSILVDVSTSILFPTKLILTWETQPRNTSHPASEIQTDSVVFFIG